MRACTIFHDNMGAFCVCVCVVSVIVLAKL